jgi:hypothetical protein
MADAPMSRERLRPFLASMIAEFEQAALQRVPPTRAEARDMIDAKIIEIQKMAAISIADELTKAFIAGFDASNECWNGEHRLVGGSYRDPRWDSVREQAITYVEQVMHSGDRA